MSKGESFEESRYLTTSVMTLEHSHELHEAQPTDVVNERSD